MIGAILCLLLKRGVDLGEPYTGVGRHVCLYALTCMCMLLSRGSGDRGSNARLIGVALDIYTLECRVLDALGTFFIGQTPHKWEGCPSTSSCINMGAYS
jgi:hypothetical protein